MNSTQYTYLVSRWMANLPRGANESDAAYFARVLERMEQAGVAQVQERMPV